MTKYDEKHLLPNMLKVRENYLDMLRDFYEPARKACAGMDFCLDLVDVFADASTVYAESGSGLYLDARHPNDRGNRIIAEALAEVVAATEPTPERGTDQAVDKERH
jgi:lysophospholipase L1-like esterase